MELQLPFGHITVIDDADWPLVSRYAWCAKPDKFTTYVHTTMRESRGRVTVRLHRLLLNVPSWLDVDHQNHDGLDNRRANLRVATVSQNMGNRMLNSNTTSNYKGVSWHKQHNQWQARVATDGRRAHLGYFADPWEAAQAYNKAALAQWGEFALLNERKPR